MSMLNMAAMRSKGRGGAFTKCDEPSVPSSSAPKATKTIDRLGAGRPAKTRASSRRPATPEALSSAPWWILPSGCGIERAGHAQAQVVVVGADHHRLGRGIGRAQDADHVPRLGPLRASGRPRASTRDPRGPAGAGLLAAVDRWLARPRGWSPPARTAPPPRRARIEKAGMPASASAASARRGTSSSLASLVPGPVTTSTAFAPGRARSRPSCAGA